MKNSFGFMVDPKPPNTTTGIHKLVKGFKNISQLFVYKEDMEEMEMEIGCPTDVKHVTHIGWDGCASATATTSCSPVKGWDNLITPDHLLSLPSPSLDHFHLSGPAHAHHPTTLLNAST
ncbi:hypothetical protein FH972_006269 [Carpinus fangiana]|uniref:CRIB domain-containing protein n=1 Tax=Carpinus fangiana TaxID=176857 RepID=A0A5N6QU65_9ROSI|nr:hypothetical protein FH972_006269 [Carpinus fangiana]